MISEITVVATYNSPLPSRGLRNDPLRDLNGNLLTDLDGNVLYSLTASYRSILTRDSFVTTVL
jgi:hypothetical protein